MAKQTQDVTTHIDAPPEKVAAFIGDVRDRTRYIPSLKALAGDQ